MDTNIKTLNENEYKFVPHETSDKLIVSFNRHNGGNDFFKYKTLLNDQRANILFLTNENNWYMDNDGGERYRNLLETYVSKFDKENVLFFGSSMGGYGALLHGIHFGVNIFANNPQVHKDIVLKHINPTGGNFANSLLKKGINLVTPQEMYDGHGGVLDSIIYVLYGDTPCDVENLKEFLKTVPKAGKTIVEKLPINDHDFWTHSVDDLMCRFEIMKNLRKVTYSDYE